MATYRDFLNAVLDSRIKSPYDRTAAEIAAGVTPTNYAYPPGDVRRYGAVGDGSTDDTAAVQRAIDVARTGALEVWCPEGTFIVSTLSCAGSLRLRGVGTIRQAASTSGNLLTITGTSSVVLIEGITFDGNASNQSAQSTNQTIAFESVGTSSVPSRLTVRGCSFVNGAFSDVVVTGDHSGGKVQVDIDGNTFRAGNDGVATTYAPKYVYIRDSVDAIVRANHFAYGSTPTVGRAGVVVDESVASPSLRSAVTVVDNVFQSVGRDASDGLGCIDVYSYGGNVIIANNRCVNAYGRAIAVKADSPRVLISGNVVDVLTTSDGAAIVCNAAVNANNGNDIVIVGNAINDSDDDGIVVNGEDDTDTGTKAGVLIEGNVIRNVATNSITLIACQDSQILNNVCDAATSHVRLIRCTGDIAIRGNLLTASTSHTILLNDSDDNTSVHLDISANTISDAAASQRAISVNDVDTVSIRANLIRNCPTGIHLQSVATVAIVMGNDVRGSSTNSIVDAGNVTAWVVKGNLFDGYTPRLRTIAAGVISVLDEHHTVDTEASAATDDLDTINGGHAGMILTLQAASSARTVVVRDGTGNLALAGDMILDNATDTITLRYDGTRWLEIGRSDNGA